MSFSYTLTTNLGKVRLLVPDNVATAYDLEDDEITYLLTSRGNNILAAAADACQWLARKYAKLATFTADGLTVQHGERAAQYAARAKELRADVAGGMSTIAITRTDGYSEEAEDSEYESRTVYIKV